jgi:hypothetical protein
LLPDGVDDSIGASKALFYPLREAEVSMHRFRMFIVFAAVVGLARSYPAAADDAPVSYTAWRHHAALPLLTTPHGADLPAEARLENFPVLVRLNAESFDFSHAKPDGADVRFSVDDGPAAFQIEHWDGAAREAAIWVRVPVIRGNARQELMLHWGNAEAKSASDGRAVFNESNGYRVVMHLGDAGDALRDEVGTVRPTDTGTTSCEGTVGRGRRFEPGQGIACGDKIDGLPTGSGPCTTETWIRARGVNGNIVGWGNEQAQGKIVMQWNAPPHIGIDAYFSGASVKSEGRLPMSEWLHVAHVYQAGGARIYVDGRLAGVGENRLGPLNVRRPARLWLGGWYGNYEFAGDLDELRISSVARSADWIRLSFENQKPNQTLVGLPKRVDAAETTATKPSAPAAAPPAVSPEMLVVNEGKSAIVTSRTDGADKVYWILVRDGKETVVAADCSSYTFDAGRVTGDASALLRLKAVYPDEVRIREIPVKIAETVPEPDYALDAPAAWNGRDSIEVVPRIRNRAEMQAAGAGELRTRWVVEEGAVIRDVAPDRLILRRSQYAGPIRVTAYLANGGREVAASVSIDVKEPSADPWVERTPEADEKPEEGQFYARDDRNKATLHYRGKLIESADEVFLKVYADDKLFSTEVDPIGADKTYALAVPINPGLVKYRVEFGIRVEGRDKVLDRVGNLVCGDAYLIDGQSNALATDTREESPRETHDWIRSYGGPTGRMDGDVWLRNRKNEAERAGLARPNLWCNPVWKKGPASNKPEHEAELGWWGMELAKRLVAEHQIPIFIINAAVGGSRIDEHLPAVAVDADPRADRADLKTMYGRMLWRLRQARLTHGIRAVLWHQGENDQGAAGPTGGYGWETYQQNFVDLSAAWKQDLPNLRRYYVFQIWPNACAMGGKHGSGDRLREAQRTLPRLYSNMSIVSTLGVTPPGGCHFPLEGWAEFARLVQPLIERDFYGKAPATSITPPNLVRARFTGPARDEIALEFDQPVVWRDELAREFYLDDQPAETATAGVAGNTLTLKLKGPSAAQRITYLKERDWNQDRLLRGTNGLAALTFCDVEIEHAAK